MSPALGGLLIWAVATAVLELVGRYLPSPRLRVIAHVQGLTIAGAWVILMLVMAVTHG